MLVNFNEALRADAGRLLKEGRVKLVIGYRSKGTARPPVFIADAAKASALVFDELCVKSLAPYLHKPEIRKKFPVAVVASPRSAAAWSCWRPKRSSVKRIS